MTVVRAFLFRYTTVHECYTDFKKLSRNSFFVIIPKDHSLAPVSEGTGRRCGYKYTDKIPSFFVIHLKQFALVGEVTDVMF